MASVLLLILEIVGLLLIVGQIIRFAGFLLAPAAPVQQPHVHPEP